jgi:hypothetical protein
MRARLAMLLSAVVSLVAWLVFALAAALLLSRDAYVADDTTGRVRYHVRTIEFDFVDWTLNAIGVRVSQASVDEQAYLDEAGRSAVVRQYFKLRAELDGVDASIAEAYGDPAVADPAAATADARAQAANLRGRVRRIQGLAEAILAEQLSVILAEQGLTAGGAPVPPVSFHFTALPYALVVSPRNVIRQDANLDVNGDLTVDQQIALEDRIATGLDVSALVVPLGGIGTYPTMVLQSSDLNWTAAVVAHEWMHNYLTLRPLGLNYMASPELRTMNETAAEMIGSELGALLVQRYYPDLAPPPAGFENVWHRDRPPQAQAVPAFDFRAAMHATRVNVDHMLADGQIEAAEAYMEAQRRVFWNHGYHIRKLNQAYFAFYGAYADAGGGAAGGDPVGTAVRLLRRRSPTIEVFVDRMAWFTSYDQLRDYLGLPAGPGS